MKEVYESLCEMIGLVADYESDATDEERAIIDRAREAMKANGTATPEANERTGVGFLPNGRFSPNVYGPKIKLCFSGWFRNVMVKTAKDALGNSVDVTKMSSAELVKKLNSRDLFVSLSDLLLNECEDSEIELFDFDKRD